MLTVNLTGSKITWETSLWPCLSKESPPLPQDQGQSQDRLNPKEACYPWNSGRPSNTTWARRAPKHAIWLSPALQVTVSYLSPWSISKSGSQALLGMFWGCQTLTPLRSVLAVWDLLSHLLCWLWSSHLWGGFYTVLTEEEDLLCGQHYYPVVGGPRQNKIGDNELSVSIHLSLLLGDALGPSA